MVKDQIVCYYLGKLYHERDGWPKDRTNCLGLGDDSTIIDGNFEIPGFVNKGKKANDGFHKDLNILYCEPVFDQATGLFRPFMEMKALRRIAKDEELFLEYGVEYWKNDKHFSRLTKTQQGKCMKYYAFKKEDVEKEDSSSGEEDDEAEEEDGDNNVQESPSSVRSSDRIKRPYKK